MKKLNNKGFGHVEILIVAAVVIVTALIGGFVWQNSKSKNSSAESSKAETGQQNPEAYEYIWTENTSGSGNTVLLACKFVSNGNRYIRGSGFSYSGSSRTARVSGPRTIGDVRLVSSGVSNSVNLRWYWSKSTSVTFSLVSGNISRTMAYSSLNRC